MKGHRKVAITIRTVLDVSDIPEEVLANDKYALKDKVKDFVFDCNQDFYDFGWEDLGEE